MSEQTGSESSNGASGVGRPSTRAARLQMVRQLLADNVVTSQAQLSELLAREGFPVTQATMSRDLDEVNAAKTRLADGTIAYAVADQVPWPPCLNRMVRDGVSSSLQRFSPVLSSPWRTLRIS